MSNWQTMHDYSSTNTEAVCVKCEKVLKGSGAKFTDDNPVCPVKTSKSLKTLLKKRMWHQLPPDSYFGVEYHPFHIQRVFLKDLL